MRKSAPERVTGSDGKSYPARRKRGKVTSSPKYAERRSIFDLEAVNDEITTAVTEAVADAVVELKAERKQTVPYLAAGLRVVDQALRKAVETAEGITNFDTDPMTDHVLKLIDGIRMKLDTVERIAKGSITDDEINQLLDGDAT